MSHYDERITTYFGDAVLRAGFMPIPHLLMRHYRELGLQTDHAMFVMQLMEITWDLAQPPTTIKKLADRMGVSVRTVQRYSEYLAARGLLVIYEQFEHGAQIENGYDLSPLFARLAALAPEPPLSGTPRERRRRGTPAHVSTTSTRSATPLQSDLRSPAVPSTSNPHDVPPPDSDDALPGDTSVMGVGDSDDVPPRDVVISPTPTQASRLKRFKNPLKKHQEPDEGGCGNGHDETGRMISNVQSQQSGGLSWQAQQQVMTEGLELTRSLLEQFGVHSNIAVAVAPTLSPAEAWSLGAYARAARLGPAWIAKQVFAFDIKQPRRPSLAKRYDHIGLQLAALAPADGFRLLGLIDGCCPSSPETVLEDGFYTTASPLMQRVASALWTLMNELRHGHVPQLAPLPSVRAYSASPKLSADEEPSSASGELWQNVLELLSLNIAPAELETWFKETRLLELDNDQAVIGTPNIFVREYLQQHYVTSMCGQLENLAGRPLQVQLVVGVG